MRIRDAAEARENEYQAQLIKKYVNDHSKITQKMTTEYKRSAINKALTEMYCSGHQRYTGKNRDLIERAQFADQEWRRLKEIYDEKMETTMAQLDKEALPTEVKESIKEIYNHYKKYMDQQDVDEKTIEKMNLLNKQSGVRSQEANEAIEAA